MLFVLYIFISMYTYLWVYCVCVFNSTPIHLHKLSVCELSQTSYSLDDDVKSGETGDGEKKKILNTFLYNTCVVFMRFFFFKLYYLKSIMFSFINKIYLWVITFFLPCICVNECVCSSHISIQLTNKKCNRFDVREITRKIKHQAVLFIEWRKKIGALDFVQSEMIVIGWMLNVVWVSVYWCDCEYEHEKMMTTLEIATNHAKLLRNTLLLLVKHSFCECM